MKTKVVRSQFWQDLAEPFRVELNLPESSRPKLHLHILSWLVGCFGFNGPLRQYFSAYSNSGRMYVQSLLSVDLGN